MYHASMNRIRYRIAWLTIGLIVGFTVAQAAPIASIGETEIDLGHVAVDLTTTFHVEVRNTGDQALTIANIQTSCPCAQPATEVASLSIPPGESFEIPFHYVPDGRSIGDAGATIAIGTNDPENPVLIANLHVFIEVPVIVRPDTGVTWSMHPRGTRLSKDLTIYPGTHGKDIELKRIEVLDPAIGVETEMVEQQRDDGIEKGIHVYFDIKPDAPLGPISTYVVAHVLIDGEEMEIKAPVKGTIIGDTLVIPPSIISPKTAYKNGDPISEIIVRPSGDGSLHRVVGAIAVGPIAIEVQTASANEQRIKVFAGDCPTGGPQAGQIFVMTSSEDQPFTTIPVYFRAAQRFEATPDEIVIEPGATQEIVVRVNGESVPPGLSFEYDRQLLRVTPNATGAVVEVAATGLTDSVATTITAHREREARLTIPVLVRVH